MTLRERPSQRNLDADNTFFEAIDRTYAAAIDPGRYGDLVEVWLRRLRSIPGPSEVDEDLLDSHLVRAMELIAQTEHNSPDQELHNVRIFDGDEKTSAMVFGGDGEVIAVSTAATELLRVAVGSDVDDLPLEAQSLTTLTTALADTARDCNERIIRVVRADTERTFLAVLSPVISRDGQSQYTVMRVGNVSWSKEMTMLLSEAFELTGAEIDVIKMLCDGALLPEIADARGSSLATVRAHLRTIYEKTETNNQVELVRIAIGLAAMKSVAPDLRLPKDAGQGEPEQGAASELELPYPRGEHQHNMTLPDGRNLSFALFGAENGRIVLVLHDYYSGDVWPAAMVEDAARRGLTILIPARPFYGRSDPYPPGVVPFDQFADDVRHLLDHLSINDFVLMTRALGAIFMMPIVDTLTDRIRGVVGVAPAMAPKKATDVEAMPEKPRFLLKTRMLKSRRLFEYAVRIMFSLHQRMGPRRFFNLIFRGTPADQAVLDDPYFFGVLRRGLEFSTRHGRKALFNDFRCQPYNAWEWALANTVPSIALVGSQDPVPRAERARSLIAEGSKGQLKIVEGAGQLLFYSHPESVLDSVEELYSKNQ